MGKTRGPGLAPICLEKQHPVRTKKNGGPCLSNFSVLTYAYCTMHIVSLYRDWSMGQELGPKIWFKCYQNDRNNTVFGPIALWMIFLQFQLFTNFALNLRRRYKSDQNVFSTRCCLSVCTARIRLIFCIFCKGRNFTVIKQVTQPTASDLQSTVQYMKIATFVLKMAQFGIQ